MVRPTPSRSIGQPQSAARKRIGRIRHRAVSPEFRFLQASHGRTKPHPKTATFIAKPPCNNAHPAACELYSQFDAAKFIGVTLEKPIRQTLPCPKVRQCLPSINCRRRPVRQDRSSETASSPTKENRQPSHPFANKGGLASAS